jgi:DNA primase
MEDGGTHIYGLWRLNAARKVGYVVVVEGESDCHTLWHHGIPAAGLPGASNWREDRDALQLADIQTIYVLIEPDAGGEVMRRWLDKSVIRDRARLVQLGAYKDPSALHCDEPESFNERFRAALTQAVA